MVEYECHAHIYSLTVPNDLPKMLAVSETPSIGDHIIGFTAFENWGYPIFIQTLVTQVYTFTYTPVVLGHAGGLGAEVSNRSKYFNYCRKSMAFWPIGMSVRCRSNERLRLWINEWVPWNLYNRLRRGPPATMERAILQAENSACTGPARTWF